MFAAHEPQPLSWTHFADTEVRALSETMFNRRLCIVNH
jgi:hypothetical protein